MLFGIETKMSEQIDVLSLYSFVLKLPEDGNTGVEKCGILILIMNFYLGNAFFVMCYLPWFHFQYSNLRGMIFQKWFLRP